jgi:hypothetical protein
MFLFSPPRPSWRESPAWPRRSLHSPLTTSRCFRLRLVHPQQQRPGGLQRLLPGEPGDLRATASAGYLGANYTCGGGLATISDWMVTPSWCWTTANSSRSGRAPLTPPSTRPPPGPYEHRGREPERRHGRDGTSATSRRCCLTSTTCIRSPASPRPGRSTRSRSSGLVARPTAAWPSVTLSRTAGHRGAIGLHRYRRGWLQRHRRAADHRRLLPGRRVLPDRQPRRVRRPQRRLPRRQRPVRRPGPTARNPGLLLRRRLLLVGAAGGLRGRGRYVQRAGIPCGNCPQPTCYTATGLSVPITSRPPRALPAPTATRP